MAILHKFTFCFAAQCLRHFYLCNAQQLPMHGHPLASPWQPVGQASPQARAWPLGLRAGRSLDCCWQHLQNAVPGHDPWKLSGFVEHLGSVAAVAKTMRHRGYVSLMTTLGGDTGWALISITPHLRAPLLCVFGLLAVHFERTGSTSLQLRRNIIAPIMAPREPFVLERQLEAVHDPREELRVQVHNGKLLLKIKSDTECVMLDASGVMWLAARGGRAGPTCTYGCIIRVPLAQAETCI